MQDFILIFGLVAPVFIIIILGYILKRFNLVNENFVSISSKIVFNISLPALLFSEIIKMDASQILDFNLVIYCCIGTFFCFGASWLLSYRYMNKPKDRAVFIQGSFRSNSAIMGLALVANIFGENSLGKAALVLAFTIPLFNILSIIALTIPFRQEKKLNLFQTLFEITKNPLTMAVLLALPFSIFRISLDGIFSKTLSYLSALTMPLALLGIGATMNMKDIRNAPPISYYASILKIVLFPFVTTYIAYLIGFKDLEMGIIFILFSTPTAIASFVMSEAMECNSKLAAHIILLSTVGSIITITLGLYLLRTFYII